MGMYAQYQGFADVNMGRGAIVIGLAAVIIGQVLFGKLAGKFCFYSFNSGIRCHYLLSGASGRAVDGTEFE